MEFIDKDYEKEFDENFEKYYPSEEYNNPELIAIKEEYRQNLKNAYARGEARINAFSHEHVEDMDDYSYQRLVDEIAEKNKEDIAAALNIFKLKIEKYYQSHGRSSSYEHNQGPGLFSRMTSWVGGYLLFRKLFR